MEEIHREIINGNRTDAYRKILKYGPEQFFKDYRSYVDEEFSEGTAFDYYADSVQLFMARFDVE